ncbi:hypothetical protein IKR55_02675 [bacterium]|jgi:hypothetical protein|nr:hypothetical protein [bacterium]
MIKKILSILTILVTLGFYQGTFAVEDIVSLDDVETPKVEQAQQEVMPIKAEIKFDWVDITQAQRDENIEKYKNLLFENNTTPIYFNKTEFNNKFSKYKKDKNYKHHYFLTNNGVTEDEEAKYCAFYFKKNTLVMYAIQYKNNPTNAFYYSAYGKLYYTDVMSKEYPNFPYSSMQYDKKGKLKSAIYFVSKDLQYMYGPDKEFQGIWYKENMYDKNGKQTIKRTNW